ncbi:response regulator [Phaeovulum vinaykumarii]|uniref:Two-component system, chemotaxis family, response regulator CheY n=1 Tax=Phaeovulum vinaykumarii TaxID=407234 RepID=A0A1N7LJS8_9RHOB|nr:response regulator [Phaeovulum vinaykumarii]SIS74073.1 two-component system, chemotaxis family, response regulator CheY [Phaeovulum vinaykumarii]SOC04871.1 two-component system chemotaxis response regulator CheY [Phaeovulum vinaykumarii]
MALRDQLRIMVVDDMSTSRGLITQALDAMGIRQVGYATDGPGALTTLEKSPVHMVISDYNMPGMNGIQLLQALRQNPRTKGVGFILITGRADAALINEGKKNGMNNFLKKPFTPQELKACIEAVVGRL